MLLPRIENHPSMQGFKPTKSFKKSVGVNFGMSQQVQSGSLQVNGQQCLKAIRDKVLLMQALEAANLPVPKPIRAFKEFYHKDSFDAVGFKTNMSYPVIARRYGQSFYLADDSDLLQFLAQRQNTDFVLFCMTMEKYRTVEVTVSPLLQETTVVREGIRYEQGVIHVDGAGNVTKIRKILEQTAMTAAGVIGMDIGNVVFAVSDKEEYQIMDITLHPNNHTKNVLMDVIDARVIRGNRF